MGLHVRVGSGLFHPLIKIFCKIGIILVAGLFWAVSSNPALSHQLNPRIIPVKQGEIFLLRLNLSQNPASSYIKFEGKKIPLFELSTPGTYGALIGIDLAMKPSHYNLDIKGSNEDTQYIIEVIPANFGFQKLTLPDDQVDLDGETLKRVEKEKREILKSMASISEDKLWEEEFVIPVEGKIAKRFGVRRILNGQPRSPHSGEDFSAPQGTSVRASNTGRVVLVGDYFFSGRSVIIDHGLGFFTMYFHLKDFSVKVGDIARKGTMIGTVGATGRATGPHLHWGVRILGARVNPLSVVDLETTAISVIGP